MIGNLVRPVRSGPGARERVGSGSVRVLDRVLSAVLASSPLCNPAEPRSSPATRATQEPAERAKQPPKQAAAAAAPGEAQQQQKQPTSTFNATVYIPSSPRRCQHLQFGARRRPRSSGAHSLAAKSASSLKNISCLGAGARIAGPLCKGWCDQRLCFQRCLATALCSQEPFLKTHSFLACCCWKLQNQLLWETCA